MDDRLTRPTGTGDPLDIGRLRQRWDGYPGLVETILAKFEAQALADLEKIRESVAGADAEQTRRLAHGLKGAAGYIAADSVQEAAAELEALARAGALAGADVHLERLRTELARCLDAIPRMLGRAGAAAPPSGPPAGRTHDERAGR